MSAGHLRAVLDMPPEEENPRQRLLLFQLADAADDQGTIWSSVAWLAERIGASRRQTSRLLSALRASGLIAQEHRGRRANRFFLLFPPSATAPRAPDDASSRPTPSDSHVTHVLSDLQSMDEFVRGLAPYPADWPPVRRRRRRIS